jgi:hypothetical protein
VVTVTRILAEVLSEIALDGTLDTPVKLMVNGFETPDGSSSTLMIRRGSTGESFATLPLDPRADLQQRSEAIINQMNDLLNAGRSWPETIEIVMARDAQAVMRQPLLDELQRHVLTVISFSDECPFCQAQAQAHQIIADGDQ